MSDSDTLALWYENETGNFRMIRFWKKVNDETVRETDVELGYNFPNGQWEVVHEFTREYEIDESGCLVGDGSGWDGHGKQWGRWAKHRFEELCRVRFPRDFGKPPVTDGRNERIIKEIAADNA